MTLTIQLTAEEEARIREQARLRGLDVQKYVRERLELPLAPPDPDEVEATYLAGLGTPEEEVQAEAEWKAWCAGNSGFIDSLMAEADEEERLGLLVPLGNSFEDDLVQ